MKTMTKLLKRVKRVKESRLYSQNPFYLYEIYKEVIRLFAENEKEYNDSMKKLIDILNI